jgi:hypothetical protein
MSRPFSQLSASFLIYKKKLWLEMEKAAVPDEEVPSFLRPKGGLVPPLCQAAVLQEIYPRGMELDY